MIKKWSLPVALCVATLMLAQCSKQKTKQKMSFNELADKANSLMAKNKNDDAISYLEEIMTRFPDNENIAEYKLTLADLYVKEERHASAHEMFEHYNQFYPSDTKAEYAKYQALLAMNEQTSQTDCDQTETENTINLCKEYLANPSYTVYRDEVMAIQNKGQKKLVEKEIYVFNFYVKHEQFDAAQNRLKHLKEKYSELTEFAPRFLYLECKLAHRQKKNEAVDKALEALIKTYPSSKFTGMATALVTRPKFIF